jgi:TonB family protein
LQPPRKHPFAASLLLAIFIATIPLATLGIAQVSPAPPQVSGAVMQSLLVKKVAPSYPPLARQARIQGTVILGATITKTGDVENIQLVSGHPMLAPAAIEAVKQWKYSPYMLNGEATEIQTMIQVNFTLPDGSPASAPANSGPSTFDPVRAPESIMRPMRIQEIDPVYPAYALQSRVQGMVVLDVLINTAGDVASIDLISGHPLLAPAAIDAVKQWRYKPFLLNGDPAPVRTNVRINFTLSADKKNEGSAGDALLDLSSSGVVGGTVSGIVSATPTAPVPAQVRRIRVSSGVAAGLLVTKVNPEYPPDARAQNIQGLVILQVNIDDQGNVVQVEPISGDPALTQASVDAVRQWKYRPYLLHGTPIAVETTVQVNFTLRGN